MTATSEPEAAPPRSLDGHDAPTLTPRSTRRATFAALADGPYRMLWWGGVASFLSVQMQMIARGWLAFDLTGNSSALGAVYLGFGLPMFVLTPLAGVAADRLPKRRMLMASQILIVLNTIMVALALTTGVMTFELLVVAAVIHGSGQAFLIPTRISYTGELVSPGRLANGIVLQQMSQNGTRVIGPSLAGVLIGVPVVGLDGVYYVSAALMLAAMAATYRLPRRRPVIDRPARSPVGELVDGLRYVGGRPRLLILTVLTFVVVLAAFPYQAFLPAVAENLLGAGAAGYGLLSGASAVGAVAASLLIANRTDGRRAWSLQVAAGVAFGAGVAALPYMQAFPAAIAAMVVVGAGASAFQSFNSTAVLGRADLAYHGRLQSLLTLSFGAFSIVSLPMGLVADSLGLRITMLAMGSVAVVATLVAAALWSRLRPDGERQPRS